MFGVTALEGADVTIAYKPEEQEDAQHVAEYILKKTDDRCNVLLEPHDLREESQCEKLIAAHLKAHSGRLDVLYVPLPLILTTCAHLPRIIPAY